MSGVKGFGSKRVGPGSQPAEAARSQEKVSESKRHPSTSNNVATKFAPRQVLRASFGNSDFRRV
jgi:hypothetical protein